MTFLPQLERNPPLIIDHSIRKELKECARRAFYKYWLNLRPVDEDIVIMDWGTCYHTFCEVLEKTSSLPKAIDAGLGQWETLYPTGVPLEHKEAWRTKERMLKMFTHKFEWWSREKKLGDIKVVAVEVPFNVELPDGSKTSGRVDQIVRWHGQLWGRDYKTTGQDREVYERTLEPNDQYDRYTFAEGVLSSEQVRGQIIEVMYNVEAAKNPRKNANGEYKNYGPFLYTLLAERSKNQIDEWIKDEVVLNEVLEVYQLNDRWPKSETQCRYCKFRQVCNMQTEDGMVALLTDPDKFKYHKWDNTLTVEENKNAKRN